jgi:hypothetical protein
MSKMIKRVKCTIYSSLSGRIESYLRLKIQIKV